MTIFGIYVRFLGCVQVFILINFGEVDDLIDFNPPWQSRVTLRF